MSLTLTANISATAYQMRVTGTVPSEIAAGYTFRLDDELMTLVSFVESATRFVPDRNHWNIQRGQGTFVNVAHTAGATIKGALDGFVNGDDEDEPDPFASGGGGSGIPQGGPLTEDLAGGDNRITGLADGVDPSDAATVGQLGSGDGSVEGVNQVYSLVVPESGEYSLQYDDPLSSSVYDMEDIPFDATAEDIQGAIYTGEYPGEPSPGYYSSVTGTGTAEDPFIIEFIDGYAAMPVTMTVTAGDAVLTEVAVGSPALEPFIRQGGTLTAPLESAADGDAFGASLRLEAGVADSNGGVAHLMGGRYASGTSLQAVISVGGESVGNTPGRALVFTDGSYGDGGQALVSDGASVVWGGVITAAGVPSGAPNGHLPFAYDTTAVTGGFYFWNGAAWVKVATIL